MSYKSRQSSITKVLADVFGCPASAGGKYYVMPATEEEAQNYINYRPLLYIKSDVTKKVLIISKDYIRWITYDIFDKLVSGSNYAFSLNDIRNNFKEEYDLNMKDSRNYWYGYRHLTNENCYGNMYVETLISLFYMDGLGITCGKDYNGKATYDYMRKVYTDSNMKMNVMQEFFINKDVPDLANTGNSSWYYDDDQFLDSSEDLYKGHDYGILINVSRFVVNKKYDKIDFSYKTQLQVDPTDTTDPNESYNSDQYEYVYPCQYKDTSKISKLTLCTFDMNRQDFDEKYKSFLDKLAVYNVKQKTKYDSLREMLNIHDEAASIFAFSVRYQNRYTFNVTEIYLSDLTKVTLDGKNDACDILKKVGGIISSVDDKNILEFKMNYQNMYINTKALEKLTIKPTVSLEKGSGYYSHNTSFVVFKIGNRTLKIIASSELLDKLFEYNVIDEDTCNELKCKLILTA